MYGPSNLQNTQKHSFDNFKTNQPDYMDMVAFLHQK